MWDSDNFHVSTTQTMQQQCPHDPPSYFRLSKSNVFRFQRMFRVVSRMFRLFHNVEFCFEMFRLFWECLGFFEGECVVFFFEI